MRIINLREGDTIASVMAVPKSEDAEEVAADAVVNTEGVEAVESVANVENENK